MDEDKSKTTKSTKQQLPRVVIVSDTGSANTDDEFALLTALMLHRQRTFQIAAIVAAHFWTQRRARVIQFYLEQLALQKEIAVYVDGDAPEENESDANKFFQQNPLWPPIFGIPSTFAAAADTLDKFQKNKKTWCPTFLTSYEEHFASQEEERKVDKNKFVDGVEPLLKMLDEWWRASQDENESSSSSPLLTLILLSPVHFACRFLTAVLEKKPPLLRRIRVVAMGGGFDDGRLGYNWGVCPLEAAQMLALSPALHNNPPLTIVTSEVVRRCAVWFSNDQHSKLTQLSCAKDKDKNTSDNHGLGLGLDLPRLLMRQWQLTRQDQKDPSTGLPVIQKLLADPLTVLVAAALVSSSSSAEQDRHDWVSPQKLQLKCVDKHMSLNLAAAASMPTQSYTDKVAIIACREAGDSNNCSIVASLDGAAAIKAIFDLVSLAFVGHRSEL